MTISFDYFADGLATQGKNLNHFNHEPFKASSLLALKGARAYMAPALLTFAGVSTLPAGRLKMRYD